MKIVDLQTRKIVLPLRVPFITALRTVRECESLVLTLICDDGTMGYGSCAPTPIISGETLASMEYAVRKLIRPLILGMEIERREIIFQKIDRTLAGNPGAKAAVNIAVYDCLAKKAELPLYQLLGGCRNRLKTDHTVSLQTTERMVADARSLTARGFDTLKIKVGSPDINEDVARVTAIRHTVGGHVRLRLDANQGWTEKKAISAICRMEDAGLDIELVEQPLPAWNFHGMARVTRQVTTPIMADESIFSAGDAARLFAIRGCDLVNIKLMKSAGIDGALKINTLAESYGIQCMAGCMIESGISIAAACHFAASQPNVTRCDLDAPLMVRSDPVDGEIRYHSNEIILSEQAGLGITKIHLR